ncbi:hypothetical protein DB346_15350 [Verrucomicrobia bacterium LW23]|nr:hypothetical protein DB346_15350 [Verrucomicrobia bacterium LW23]
MSPLPNILLIIDDQHRHDWIGGTGASPVRTPNLDRLRSEGVWHRHMYSNNPLCMPARCSLISGLFSHQSGQMNNNTDWPPQMPTMPQALQRAGYHTALIGKLHAFEGVPINLDLTTVRERIRAFGFDHVNEVSGKMIARNVECDWTYYLRERGLLDLYRADQKLRNPATDGAPFPLDEEHYVDHYIGDNCVKWLDEYNRPDPFFLWAGFCSPHPTYDAPARWLEPYPQDRMPPPADLQPGDTRWRIRRSQYAAMIELVDHEVGRLLEVLDRRGMASNTLVIFVSDHGEMLDEHGLRGKCLPHDPSIRVPCVARWPGHISPGTISDELANIVDLTGACVRVGGYRAIEEALPDARLADIVGHWRDQRTALRPHVFSENGGQFNPPWRVVRTQKLKWIQWARDGRETLHDMENDPHECHDLATLPAYRSELAAMRDRLDRFLGETSTACTARPR